MRALSRGRRCLPSAAFSIVISLGALVSAPLAHASSNYLSTWSSLYPNSASDNNASCQLCHGTSTQNVNPYGLAVAQCNGATGTITQRIQAAEGLNSDNDAGGYTNLEETNANTQPGWTTPNVPRPSKSATTVSTMMVMVTPIAPIRTATALSTVRPAAAWVLAPAPATWCVKLPTKSIPVRRVIRPANRSLRVPAVTASTTTATA